MTPKIKYKVKVSKERKDEGLKDANMQKAKSIILENKIRSKNIIQKKK